jgi:hypothetical protein
VLWERHKHDTEVFLCQSKVNRVGSQWVAIQLSDHPVVMLLKMKIRVSCVHLNIVWDPFTNQCLDGDNERLIKPWLIAFAIPWVWVSVHLIFSWKKEWGDVQLNSIMFNCEGEWKGRSGIQGHDDKDDQWLNAFKMDREKEWIIGMGCAASKWMEESELRDGQDRDMSQAVGQFWQGSTQEQQKPYVQFMLDSMNHLWTDIEANRLAAKSVKGGRRAIFPSRLDSFNTYIWWDCDSFAWRMQQCRIAITTDVISVNHTNQEVLKIVRVIVNYWEHDRSTQNSPRAYPTLQRRNWLGTQTNEF